MSGNLTPREVEQRLLDLSKELDEANIETTAAEAVYLRTKTTYEIKLAQKRLEIGGEFKTTAQERADLALTALEDYAMELTIAETSMRANKANVARIKEQIDVARSLGTSVRASYDAL